MGEKKALGYAPQTVVEQWDEEADELNMSRIEYVRQRVNAGRMLFNSGRLDVELLDELMETDGSERPVTDVETLDSDISQEILSVLPRDEDRGATIDELRVEIFGTPEDQKSLIKNVLKKLNDQGKVRSAFEEGYIKNE